MPSPEGLQYNLRKYRIGNGRFFRIQYTGRRSPQSVERHLSDTSDETRSTDAYRRGCVDGYMGGWVGVWEEKWKGMESGGDGRVGWMDIWIYGWMDG